MGQPRVQISRSQLADELCAHVVHTLLLLVVELLVLVLCSAYDHPFCVSKSCISLLSCLIQLGVHSLVSSICSCVTPSLSKLHCSDLRTFSTVPLPMPYKQVTVSQPESTCTCVNDVYMFFHCCFDIYTSSPCTATNHHQVTCELLKFVIMNQ